MIFFYFFVNIIFAINIKSTTITKTCNGYYSKTINRTIYMFVRPSVYLSNYCFSHKYSHRSLYHLYDQLHSFEALFGYSTTNDEPCRAMLCCTANASSLMPYLLIYGERERKFICSTIEILSRLETSIEKAKHNL